MRKVVRIDNVAEETFKLNTIAAKIVKFATIEEKTIGINKISGKTIRNE